MASITFDRVTKRFGTTSVVEDLTLEIADKEFLVLVGPSGCGKTTTLRMLAGLEPITGGNILIGDRVVNNVASKDRDIAMVFQTYALYPHMSVYDNMAFGLSLRKTPKAEIKRRVQEAAEILGIAPLLDRKPRQLSGGQRQRVALGRAIVRQPEAFLFDEPLSNLDAKLRVQTRAELNKLHRRLGTTFVYVTHDQVEAMTMATRMAVMEGGHIQQVGTPEEVYNHPVNVFVAGFIGSPAMNFVEGVTGTAGGGLVLHAGGMQIPLPRSQWPDLRDGQRLIMGIRPEHFYNPRFRDPGEGDVTLDVPIDVSEELGNETFLHFQLGDRIAIARVDPRTHESAGTNISLAVDVDRVHLFDPETTVAVTRAADSAADTTRESELAPA